MIVSDYISTSEQFLQKFYSTLNPVVSSLPDLINFKSEVQKKNLMSLVDEANKRIHKYEHIYPYIKELSKGQAIDPTLYLEIEKVLNWALKKGRGKSRILSEEIKNAWITYIVFLSCSMIDKEESDKNVRRNIFLKSAKGKMIGLKGSD